MSTEVKDKPEPRLHYFHSATGSGWQHWRRDLRELIHYRFLLKNLVARDLKVRYKNSALGFLWSLLNPLLMMIVYTILFTVLWANNDIRDYPIFILVGLIPWQFLSNSLIGGTTSITSNSPLVKKVYFPRIILPTTTVLSNLVNFLLAFLVLIVLLYALGDGLTVQRYLGAANSLHPDCFYHGIKHGSGFIAGVLPGCVDGPGCPAVSLVFPHTRLLIPSNG